MSTGARSRGPARKRLGVSIGLAIGILCILAGSGLIVLYAETAVDPGGPACTPQAPCPVSPWYTDSTRSAEIAVGLTLLAGGAVVAFACVAVLRVQPA